MSKKFTGPRLVNPEDRPAKEQIPYKTIILTTVVSGTAGFILAKVLDTVWEKGKKATNPLWNRLQQNPAGLPGAMGPQQPPGLHSPYSQMAQTQGLPFTPPEAPTTPKNDDEPPRWAQKFLETYEARLTALEQTRGPKLVDSDEDAA